jgi:hypothetical protein
LAGLPGSPVTLTASNSGTGALAFSGIRVTGTNPGDFVIGSNTCASTNTPAGSACTIQVSFSPACVNDPAVRLATLALTDNVPGSPQNVPLSGTATGDFCFDPPVGATTATVTAGQTATYSLVIYSPNAYTGSVGLSCAGAPPAGACITSVSTVTLPAQFAVTVTTTANSFVAPRAWNPGERFGTVQWLTIFATFAGVWTCWLLICAPNRKHPYLISFVCLPLLLILALALGACGGGSDASSTSSDPGTPDQTYPLTLTGTAADGTTRTLNLTLNVQN